MSIKVRASAYRSLRPILPNRFPTKSPVQHPAALFSEENDSAPEAPIEPTKAEAPVAGAEIEAAKNPDLIRSSVEVKSPMVGNVLSVSRARCVALPWELAATVGEDTVLCIVEAMKIMNEIKAEITGEIAEVLVENGQPRRV